MTKYRVRRQDGKNSSKMMFLPSRLIEKGKYQGQMSQATWSVIGYYGKVNYLIRALINRELDLEMKIGPNFEAKVLGAIDQATKRIIENLECDDV